MKSLILSLFAAVVLSVVGFGGSADAQGPPPLRDYYRTSIPTPIYIAMESSQDHPDHATAISVANTDRISGCSTARSTLANTVVNGTYGAATGWISYDSWIWVNGYPNAYSQYWDQFHTDYFNEGICRCYFIYSVPTGSTDDGGLGGTFLETK